MKKKILLAFDDPGGGLAVSSLIERLNQKTNSVLVIYSGKLSQRFLKEMNFEYKEINSNIDKKEAAEIIELEKPDMIITGTGGGSAEQELRNVAFKKNIKSVVILDFWKDYSRRWKYSDHSFGEMKDLICVMDELTKEEIIRENFNKENIIVTGHPYLDKIFKENIPAENSSENVSGFRNVLFFSQPLEIIGVKEYKVHPLEILIYTLNEIAAITKEEIKLTIKLHPSENKTEELIEILDKHNSGLMNIILASENEKLNELIIESDLVIGYNTIALFEARAAGKRTISLNVAKVNRSLTKAMQDAGVEIADMNRDNLYLCLSNSENKNASNNDVKFSGGIDNCVNVILKELSLN